jgi:hypothetical protein
MTKSRFELKTFDFDTILNYHLSQNVKLIGKEEFSYSASAKAYECSVFVIFGNEKLGFAKFGDDKLTLVVERSKYDVLLFTKANSMSLIGRE